MRIVSQLYSAKIAVLIVVLSLYIAPGLSIGAFVDFAFDQQTHLPIEVRLYDVVDNRTYKGVSVFSIM